MPVARPAGRVEDLNGPEAWFSSLPIITRYWFAVTCALTLSANFGIFSPVKLLFLWKNIKDSFEVWRFATPFCYAGPFHISTLFRLYMLVQFSRQYEAGGPYNTGAGGGTADYVFHLLFAVVVTFCTYPFLVIYFQLRPLFTQTLISFVLYVWSKRNPTAQANIWGFPIKGIYLPFAYLALTVVTGNPYFDMLHGYFIGHIFYFLVDVVPMVYGKDVLQTPQFLVDYFGVGEYVPPVGGPPAQGNNTWNAPGRVNPPNDPAAGRQRGHNWGSGGRALGTD